MSCLGRLMPENQVGTIQNIPLTDLLLDPENYRLEPQATQLATIHAMIAEQEEKLIELAEDILELGGLSPIVLTAVCRSNEPGKYMVVEGNRRVTALKLLRDPALATGTSIEKRINKIATGHTKKLPNQVECRIMASKQEAFPWIRRIHDIGMGGAAVVSWSPIAIRRAQEAGGLHHSTLRVLDFVSRSSKLSSPEKQMLRKFPVTNLERLLDNPDILA